MLITSNPKNKPVDLHVDAPWRPLAEAYYAHHNKCATCIPAGRGEMYGPRCEAGALLLAAYDEALA